MEHVKFTQEIEIQESSTVTAKGYRHRTTIPSKIFHKLQLKDKERLLWFLMKDGTVIIAPANPRRRA